MKVLRGMAIVEQEKDGLGEYFRVVKIKSQAKRAVATNTYI